MDSSPRVHLDGMLSPTSATRRSVGHSTEVANRSEQFTDFGAQTPSSKESPWNGKIPTNALYIYRSRSISSRQPTTPNSLIKFTTPATGNRISTTPLLNHSMITYNDATKATESQASMQLLNAVMGAAIVGYPFCFKSCGLLLATLLVLVTVLAAEFSMQLLLLAAHVAGKRSYEEIARYCFGHLGKGLVDFSISVINLGSLVAYLNLASDTFSLVAGTIVPPGAEPSRTEILLGITLFIALPLCLFVRSPRVLASVSQASVAFLLLFAGIFLVLGVVGSTASSFSTLQWWDWNGVLTAFPVIAYSFTAHQVLFAVYLGMNKPSVQKMTGVVTKTMSAAASVYIAVGIAGYKAFGVRTHGDVLRNLGGGNGSIAEHLVKVGYGLSLLASLPLLMLPLQTTFAPAVNRLLRLLQSTGGEGGEKGASFSSHSTAKATNINHGGTSSPVAVASAGTFPLLPNVDVNKNLREGLVTSGVLGIACTIAALVPNVEYVFGLAGSTASVLISFVFPAAIFLSVSGTQGGNQGHGVNLARDSPKWRQRRRAAAVLLLFGLIAGVACTAALLTSIQEEAEVVQLAQEIAKEEKKAADAVATKEEAASVAYDVGVIDEARRKLDATREGLGETLLVVEKAEENAAAAAAAAAASEGKGKTNPALTTQQVVRAQKATQKAAAKDLKPALAAAEQAVAELEGAAAGLDAALALKNLSSSSSHGSAGGIDDANLKSDTWLEVLRAAGLEALQAVRESRLALSEAERTLKMRKSSSSSGGGRLTGNQGDTLETVLRKVVAASSAASKKVDETLAALAIAEEEQREEVAEIVVKLGEQRKEKLTTAAVVVGETEILDKASEVGDASSTSPKPPVDTLKEGNDKISAPLATKTSVDATDLKIRNIEETSESLEEDLHAGREVNATRVAQAAADAADDIVETAKEAAEQAVGKAKTVDVAVRAIEIAKELAGNGKSNSGGSNRGGEKQGEEVEGGKLRDKDDTGAEKYEGSEAKSASLKDEEAQHNDGDGNGDTLLGNLTAVAEAVAGKVGDDVAVEVSSGRKSSRKLDPAR
ncbi:hypothetical protein Ndes2526A_g08720 [Nannochloris sp. 'desiccata']